MTENTKASGPGFASDAVAGLIRNVIHPLWAKRTHPAYARYLREFERNQYLDPAELRTLQMQRLRQQLIHAYRYVPFYRHRMTEAGLTPLDIQTHDDLSLLPVLTKRDIQDHQDMLVASNIPAAKRARNQTGGSTGSPLQFYVDLERSDSRMASTARHDRWAGIRPGDWTARLWGATMDVGECPAPPSAWRQTLLYRSLTLNTSAITDEAMQEYVLLLRRYRPKYMVAYAQAAVVFSDFCRRQGIEDIRFESMVLSAEMLLPGQRNQLEETFGGKVFNRYGCREVSVIASECEYHTGLHVNADALLVEVESTPNLPAGMGRILVTDLLNRSMPLIRYEIGDLATLEMTQCSCGRSLPLLGRIEGRLTDFLKLPSQRLVSGVALLTFVVAPLREVRQVQFLQRDPTHVTLKVVAGHGYGAHTEQELRRRLRPYLGDQIELTIALTDSIASEPSGKYRYVKRWDENPRTNPGREINKTYEHISHSRCFAFC